MQSTFGSVGQSAQRRDLPKANTRTKPERTDMQIQTNTDNHIDGHLALAAHVESVVRKALRHVQDRISRVEVHLGDESGSRTASDDKRCVMEARIDGRSPLAVTQNADSLHQAIDGAARKLKAALETALGRQSEHK
jgi:ribosome-associated translation inhibitor RaiA